MYLLDELMWIGVFFFINEVVYFFLKIKLLIFSNELFLY